MNRTFASIFAFMMLTACGVDENSSQVMNNTTAENGTVSVEAGNFRLYRKPDSKPNPSCDIYTSLSLINGFSGAVATLENQLDGVCEIAIQANSRVYNLTEMESSCGTRIYRGKISEDGKTIGDVEIRDHRKRLCHDLQPSRIVVTERFDSGRTSILYSHD